VEALQKGKGHRQGWLANLGISIGRFQLIVRKEHHGKKGQVKGEVKG